MARTMSAQVSVTTEDLRAQLDHFDENLDHKVGAVFDLNAAFGEAWMKINAPWTDNTGAARSGLTATHFKEGNAHELLLAYSVSYGIWLEVANSGRFAILGPAMQFLSQKIMSDLRYIIDSKPPTSLGSPTRTIPPQARKVARKGTANKSGSRRSRKAYGNRNR